MYPHYFTTPPTSPSSFSIIICFMITFHIYYTFETPPLPSLYLAWLKKNKKGILCT